MIPTIIEDDVFVGGNCGIYEGTHVHRHAVIASGTVITRSTRLYDLPNERVVPLEDGVVNVPEGAVVVSGSRPVSSEFGRQHGIQIYTPIIIKYRDEKTSTGTALETAFRM